MLYRIFFLKTIVFILCVHVHTHACRDPNLGLLRLWKHPILFRGAGVAPHAHTCEVSTAVYSQCVIFWGSLTIYVAATYHTIIKRKEGKLSTGWRGLPETRVEIKKCRSSQTMHFCGNLCGRRKIGDQDKIRQNCERYRQNRIFISAKKSRGDVQIFTFYFKVMHFYIFFLFK